APPEICSTNYEPVASCYRYENFNLPQGEGDVMGHDRVQWNGGGRATRATFSDFAFLFFADLAATDSPAALAAVPWALGALTAEFGMGSGGIPPLGPPGRRRTEYRSRVSEEIRESGYQCSDT